MPDTSPTLTSVAGPEAAAQDLELVRRARGGEYEAFEALVHRFQQRIHALAWRILGQQQDAEDVVQQTFLSALEHLDAFREEATVATWLLRIATNHALKMLRKRRGLPTLPLESTDVGDSYAALPHPQVIARWRDTPEQLVLRKEVRQLLDQAMTELDDKYRLVFVLRDVEGLSIKETAEALGLSDATVKIRLLRARLHLRERLIRVVGDEATRLEPGHDHGS